MAKDSLRSGLTLRASAPPPTPSGGSASLRLRAHGSLSKWELHPVPPYENSRFFNLRSTYEKFSPFADTFKKRVSKNTFFVLVRVVDELW